jgi:hypothetical protein
MKQKTLLNNFWDDDSKALSSILKVSQIGGTCYQNFTKKKKKHVLLTFRISVAVFCQTQFESTMFHYWITGCSIKRVNNSVGYNKLTATSAVSAPNLVQTNHRVSPKISSICFRKWSHRGVGGRLVGDAITSPPTKRHFLYTKTNKAWYKRRALSLSRYLAWVIFTFIPPCLKLYKNLYYIFSIFWVFPPLEMPQ